MKQLLFVALFLLGGAALGEERILSYHSDIDVLVDGSMLVTETITVNSEQDAIRRGIYRDFPTRYEDRYGNNYVVDFSFLSAERDGATENFRVEDRQNGVRIYLGRSDRVLPRGIHNYEIRYRTLRQLGFFDGRDELYWNVNGNGWDFPAGEVSATVMLPDGVDRTALDFAYYTGAYGSASRNAVVETDAAGNPTFRTDRALAPGEGLTIVVGWPAGVVARPSNEQKLEWFFRDNRAALIGAGGLLFVLLYYAFAWHRVGRDPAAGTIIPLYEPPENLSPAAMRYIMRMNSDNPVFGAAVISMAVKGYLAIEQQGSDYILKKHDSATDEKLSKGERALAAKLFRDRSDIRLENSNHRIVRDARNALQKTLQTEYNRVMFRRNQAWLLPGVLASIIAILAAILSTGIETPVVLFLLVWLAGWNVGVIGMLRAGHWFMALVFGFAEIPVFFMLLTMGGVTLALFAALLVILNVVFFHLIKAPTSLGRRMMDRIEGFALYLSVAEKDELAGANPGMRPPEKTPALYERYLPYALALGVEQAWSEKFAQVLAAAAIAGEGYSPGWYRGSSWSTRGVASFGSALGSSLSSAISSAATAPGSSSGGGGGGFSGGGGGGGGGGGW